jgi:hypothetical protein
MALEVTFNEDGDYQATLYGAVFDDQLKRVRFSYDAEGERSIEITLAEDFLLTSPFLAHLPLDQLIQLQQNLDARIHALARD